MRISEVTTPALVFLDVPWGSQHEVTERLAAALAADGAITDPAGFRAALAYREELGPTGMQDGLAIPHGKSHAVRVPRVAMARLSTPIRNWQSVLPGHVVDLVIMMAIPATDSGGMHIGILSQLGRRFSDSGARGALLAARTAQEFIDALELPPQA